MTDKTIWVSGIILVGIHVVLAGLSSEFPHGRPLVEKPVWSLVALELAAGAVFLFTVGRLRALGARSCALAWIVLAGVLLRLVTFNSVPMLEDDFYRYLWDGAVTAHGYNPFRYAPDEVLDASASVPPELRRLAEESGEIIHRVNHPELKSIYPPAAQAAFAAAYFLGPWSIWAWRVVLAVFDAGTLLVLLAMLKDLKLPAAFVLIYWWNPLVVREIFNTCHMDALVLPLTAASLLFAHRGRSALSAVMLALGVGTKLWPLVLLPVVLPSFRSDPRRFLTALGLFAAVTVLVLYPMYHAGFDRASGVVAYGKTWQMNDSAYMVQLWCVRRIGAVFGFVAEHAHLITRGITAVLLLAWIAQVGRTPPKQPTEIWERSLLITAALFLLSPTQFPWYYLWMVPLLVVKPRMSLLVLGILLPFYYARFYFRSRGDVEIFDDYLVWVQYIPVWILLAREGLKGTEILGEQSNRRPAMTDTLR